MDEVKDIEVTETDAEDSGFGGVFAEFFDDDLEEEVIEQPAEEEPGEVTEEPSESTEADQPEATDDGADIETENETDTSVETETEPSEVAQPQPTDTYELKHLDSVQTVDRGKVIELAQKGLDYDRIRADRDTMKAENSKLKAEHDFLQELADSSKMTVEQLIDETRADIISKRDGTKKEIALQQVRAQREAKAATFKADALEAARQKDYEAFSKSHPDLDPKDIPAEVWQRMNDGNLLLSEAYAPIDIKNAQKAAADKAAELESLKSRLAALEQNEKNRERSTGSRKSTGASVRPKSTFSEAWDAWDS